VFTWHVLLVFYLLYVGLYSNNLPFPLEETYVTFSDKISLRHLAWHFTWHIVLVFLFPIRLTLLRRSNKPSLLSTTLFDHFD